MTKASFCLSAFLAVFCLVLFSKDLPAQTPDSTVSIVLEFVMPHIKPVNNINLPGFHIYFENNTDTYSLFEATPNYRVKTKRLRYLLTDPAGNTHIAAPVAKHHDVNDDGSNYTVLKPDEKTRNLRHDIQGTLEQHFWDWWQSPLWEPGEYTLTIAYFPGPYRSDLNTTVVQDTVYSNSLSFTIHPTPQYLPEPDHHHKINKGFIRGQREDEKYIHIRYANAASEITAERIYISRPQSYTELIFELVYDQPIPPKDSVHWRLIHKEIHTGHGSQHIPYWVPTVAQETITGMARTWHYRESYIKKGRPLAEVRYQNGKLNGPVEIYLDGKHIRGQYEQGDRNGTWAVWRDSIQFFRAEFKDDVFHGDYRMNHHLSSTPWKMATYKNGQPHGVVEEFFENGQLENHFEYQEGEVVGLGIWYDKEGNERAKGMYLNGLPYNGTFFTRFRGTVAGGSWLQKENPGPATYREGILQLPESDSPKRKKRP